LVISARNDPHLPYVLKHVTKEVLIIDPVQLVAGDFLDYAFQGEQTEVVYKGRSLQDVDAVWYRRPSPVSEVSMRVDPSKLAYAQSAINRHVLALNYLLTDALWISDVHSIKRADVKPLQLQFAAAVGLNVPETIFVSSHQTAQSFLEKHGRCIVKPQAVEFPKGMKCYAKVVHKNDKLNFAGLKYDPYIMQAYVVPRVEYRVTVVGDTVFSAAIKSANQEQPESYFRDWRTAYQDGSFRAVAVDLSSEVEAACVQLVRMFGLQYGAIDLIEDEEGRIWFLEINPNGQWAFIEREAGLPIGESIAEMLSMGHASPKSLSAASYQML